jgi:hypothetical protein
MAQALPSAMASANKSSCPYTPLSIWSLAVISRGLFARHRFAFLQWPGRRGRQGAAGNSVTIRHKRINCLPSRFFGQCIHIRMRPQKMSLPPWHFLPAGKWADIQFPAG